MVLQVHDEIVFECAADKAEHFANLIKYEMEHVTELSVPLLTEATISDVWDK